MPSPVPLPVSNECQAILDRHANRRNAGIPTVSVLIGPRGPALRAWRRWASGAGHAVVAAAPSEFPLAEWARAAAKGINLPEAAIQSLAGRIARGAEELRAAWHTKSPPERELFWSTLPPRPGDETLRAVLPSNPCDAPQLPLGGALATLGERCVPQVIALAPSAKWPGVLFDAGTTSQLPAAGRLVADWAIRVPSLPLALVAEAGPWAEYLAAAPESRAKALLREGLIAVPALDADTVERVLAEAGVDSGTALTVAAHGADAALVEVAAEAARATKSLPADSAEDDNARSKAERFLFEFLESLPETAGRFELNGRLDFQFGPRPAEVDLLCRAPRLAVEVDGYYHFQDPERYRRDRAKDWELQRRGYVVLRFLATDVIPELELVRDRILDALRAVPIGALP